MTLRLNGSNSGFTEVKAPATAGSNTITLPTSNGSAEQFLKNSGTAGELEYSSMVETSTGVGIGTTSPATSLHVDGSGSQYIRVSSSTNSNFIQAGCGSGSTFHEYKSVYRLVDTDNGERMRVDSSGFLCIGGTATVAGAKIGITFNGQTTNGIGLQTTFSGTGSDYIRFNNSAGNQAGEISQSGTTSVSYTTSSDYRLKENVVDIADGIARVKQLAPKRFNFIEDGPDRVVDGFIAHEAQTVVPEAVTGTHNEVDDDDNPVYQGIDQSKLVPLLTAALQEAISKIETLETKVAALEAA